MYFNNGDTYGIQVEDTVTGVLSGATAEVLDVDLFSGSWSGGDAEGFMRVRGISGLFTDSGENLSFGLKSDLGYADGLLVGGISDYLAHKMLNFIFNGTAYTGPDTYLVFSTGSPEDYGSGISEPSGNNYARLLVDNWTTAGGGVAANDATVTMNTPSGRWGTVDYAFLAAALTSGNLLFYVKLRIANAPSDGDTVRFLEGDLEVSVDTQIQGD